MNETIDRTVNAYGREKFLDCVLFGKPYPEEIQMEVKKLIDSYVENLDYQKIFAEMDLFDNFDI